ncbi:MULTISPECIES: ABC transporter permease [Streptomyces]|uniref:ABC transporter permease n=1 Tax=Streptomyces TaxID=1883 RepID=UPI001884C237|nr:MULTISPECIES: ABC transporter permease [Streptomyces]MCU8593190.1 ABC transporter permease [Streptomyces sp. A13(2022)]WFB82323.1 ABC transporter permease [Streptomyces olivaceus]WGK44659.1 ABC transporter permease [Streptomyces sp. B146]
MPTGTKRPKRAKEPEEPGEAVAGPPAGDDGGDADVAAGRNSPWRLVWRRFRKHRLAVVGAVVVLLAYLVVAFAEFLAPGSPSAGDARHTYAPPQMVKVDLSWGDGLQMYVNGFRTERDPETYEQVHTVDPDRRIPVKFLARGDGYDMWGLIPWDRHLIGSADPDQKVYFLGTDRSGRDMLSRIVHGARVSLSIGLIGVAVSFLLGLFFGGVSGYFGGAPDTLIQRIIEFLMAIPTLPLWLSLSAAVPADWGPMMRYFAITTILSVIGWTGLARVVRGRFLSLREEDFVTAARLDGCGRGRIIFRHMVPSMSSHVIASLTMAVPAMILGETAMSFLGLGLQSPAVSWGVLLQEAQNVRTLETAPWLLIPGAAVFVTVLAMNFVGDGLRDAADPYKQ